MSGLGVAHDDYPDLDELLDIGDAHDIVSSTTSNPRFDVDNVNEVFDWYTNPEISKSHFESQIVFEKEKKENEAGLVEALQKSIDIECQSSSDLVSLSSSFVNPLLAASASHSSDASITSSSFQPFLSLADAVTSPSNDSQSVSSAPSSGAEVLFDETTENDESMLKTLLLSQTNINYPREVNANNNNFMVDNNFLISGKKSTSSSKRHRMSKKQSVTKKPFTELRKHFELATSNTSKTSKKNDSTRVVNASRYMKQYGSAPTSRIPSLLDEDTSDSLTPRATITVSTRPPVVARSCASGRKQSIEVSLPAKSVRAKSVNLPTREKSYNAADANTLLDILENRASQNWKPQSGTSGSTVKGRMLIDKRRSTLLIDPLPNKKQKTSSDEKAEDTSTPTPSSDEFTEMPSEDHNYCHKKLSPAEESVNQDILHTAIQASGLTSDQKADEMTHADCTKSNKILKWQDYLQRVRLGIRSAPNSPTCSPKIKRGSSRPANNFMVVGPTGAKPPTKKPVTQLVEPIVAAKAPKRKVNLKLQEFEEYLAKIQNKTGDNNTANNQQSTHAKAACAKPKNTAPEHSTAKSKRANKLRPKQVCVPPVSSTSYVKISSGGVVHTAAVASAHTANRSAPFVMIQIPKMAHSTSAQQSSTVKELLRDPRKHLKPRNVKVLKSISKVKWNADKTSAGNSTSQGHTTQTTTATTSSANGPTFKLVTSNKGGVETKSLILSGVSGKLKEILTLLAQQQQQQGTSPAENSQQQKTMEQLLSAVSSLKASKSKPTVVESNTQDSKAPPPVSKSIPSALSLIHEIKQNLVKKPEAPKKILPKTSKSRPHYVYTVPATSTVTLIQVPGKTKVTSGGGMLSVNQQDNDKTTEMKSQSSPVLQVKDRRSKSLDSDPNQITVFVDQKYESGKGQGTSEKTPKQSEPSLDEDSFLFDNMFNTNCSNVENTKENVVSEMDLLAGEDLPYVTLPASNSFDTEAVQQECDLTHRSSPEQDKFFIDDLLKEIVAKPQTDGSTFHATTKFASGQEKLTENDPQSSVSLETQKLISSSGDAPPVSVNSLSATASSVVCSDSGSFPEKASQLTSAPVCENMAAPEASHASEPEVFLPKMENRGLLETDDSQPISFIASQETVECLDDDNSTKKDFLFNKLPAYLYSGKVLNPGTSTGANTKLHSQNKVKGMKELSSDPLISIEGHNSDLEQGQYNKVPHYLRGGKACPRMRKSSKSYGSSGSLHSNFGSGSRDGYPVLKRTPEGALVNTNELFYSRLPSYLSAGRYHVVDTVTEPPPPADETVTPESMWKQDQEEKRKKQEKKKKRKKKRKKQKKHKEKQLDKDRLLYSKLPHYFLAGRRSLVPDRRASEQSYSSSLSDSSASDDRPASYRNRPHSYRSRNSSERGRSTSLSSWSSRSPSRSPSRSWKAHLSGPRSPRRRPFYTSSDSEYSTSRSRTRKRRRSYSSDSDWEEKRRKRSEDKSQQLKKAAIQERRVMYVGGIDDNVDKSEIRERFEKFGPIEEICLHFRRDRDSYAFVTFRFTCDTFAAIEQGNSDVTQPKYTLCFGGRREFCQVEYADLDEHPEYENHPQATSGATEDDDFDSLLKQAMRR